VPFVYTSATKTVADVFATSASAGTEIDALFVKPGARNVMARLLQVLGRGAGLTALSGIAFHLKRWTSTASSGGTAITPEPHDPGAQAATASAGGASAGVTSGTGGPVFVGMAGCGAAGPGGWAAQDADSANVVQGAATQTLDVFVESGTASLNYECALDHAE
jgi:hypothetical protein